MTMTPSRPSELPLVLMVATMGFRSQMLANLRPRSVDMLPPAGDWRMSRRSHPATMSDSANRTLPKENQAVPGHAVGKRIQASKGV